MAARSNRSSRSKRRPSRPRRPSGPANRPHSEKGRHAGGRSPVANRRPRNSPNRVNVGEARNDEDHEPRTQNTRTPENAERSVEEDRVLRDDAESEAVEEDEEEPSSSEEGVE